MVLLPGEIARAQVVNEFMAANSSANQDPQGQYDDWIEIYNNTAAPVDIGGMYVTDDLLNPTKHMIPTGSPGATTIAPGGWLVLWADDDTADGPLHLGFKLDGAGEAIALYDTDGATLLDSVTFDDQISNVSFGRFPDGGTLEWRFFDTPTPGAANAGGYPGRVEDTKFSHKRGFHNAPFSVAIACATPSSEIRYTLDSSDPTESSTLYTGPILIDTTKVLRARAYRANWLPTNVDTQTYIFPADVMNQPALPAGFPATWGGGVASNIEIDGDYEMDPEIIYKEDPPGSGNLVYFDRLTSAMLTIPSLSLAMRVEDWFSPETGLISNSAYDDLDAWRRACSAELIYPDGRKGFQIDCGVGIAGGSSVSSSFKVPKHSMRLRFSEKYGPTRLRVDEPILPGSPSTSYNTLVLDARMNYAWCYYGGSSPNDQREKAQYIRDQYANDLQNAMDDPSPHGFYAHLFLNGLYWGLYCIHERPDDAFIADYLGGDAEDYDVMKHRISNIVGGSNADLYALFSAAREDLSDTAKYEAFAQQYLDIPEFIDYMIMNYYGGNGDWAHHNWYCGRNRENGSRFRYYSWDAEKVIVSETRDLTGRIDTGGPTELAHQLKVNEEFALQFGDRAHKLLYNNGLLTPDRARELYDKRVEEIDYAIILESARWGDHARDHRTASSSIGAQLYERDIHWIDELNRLRTSYFPQHTATALNQFRNAGLYPNVDAPKYMIDGASQHGGTISSGAVLTIENPNSTGTLYYSLDGTDPRYQVTGGRAARTTLVAESAEKDVLVPASDIGTDWRTQISYSIAGWTHGTGGVGYERSSGYDPYFDIDVNTAMQSNTSCYIRIPFTVAPGGLEDPISMDLNIRYDDGFAAYLNGVLIAQDNTPGPLGWDSVAPSAPSDSTALRTFDATSHLGQLTEGQNLLAIHALNKSLTSSDFLNSPELVVTTGSPQGPATTATLTDTTRVLARVYDGANWSALNDATYQLEVADKGALRITEVMYNPAPPAANSYWTSDDFEFIEIANMGAYTVDLSGVTLDDGVYFTFSDSATNETYLLAPGERVAIVSDLFAFRSRYGDEVYVAGQYFGSLDNAGERVRLRDGASDTIVRFTYNDAREWPQAADGAGHSLVPLDSNPAAQASGAGDYGGNWRASTLIHGSPGEADPSSPSAGPIGVLLNEIAAHTDYVSPPPDSNDWIELYNPTAGDVVLNDCYLSDSIRNLAKWQIPNGATIGPGAFLSFDEVNDFHAGAGFGLNKDGERVVLSYLPGTGGDRVIDEVRFKGQRSEMSLGRYPDGATAGGPGVGSWGEMFPTRDGANNPQTQGLVINQLMYHPDDGTTASEYVEIHNPTTSTVNLWNSAGYYRLSGGVEYEFQTNVALLAGSYLLILNVDPSDSTALDAFKAKYGVTDFTSQLFGPYKDNLANGGERLAIEQPEAPDLPGEPNSWVIVDETFYFDKPPFPTLADGQGSALHRILAADPGPDPANWAAAPPNLDHVGTAPPFVLNLAAADLTSKTVTVGAKVGSTGGEDPTVRIYWGASDGGTDGGAWQNYEDLGVMGLGSSSAALTGLSPVTTYYYRASAMNTAGGAWASVTGTFTTLDAPPEPPTVSHLAPVRVTHESATLKGKILDTGRDDPVVTFYWGPTDGGTTPGGWANQRSLGTLGAVSFSTDIVGLSASTAYYYQVSAANSAGTSWASASGTFTSDDPPPIQLPAVTTGNATNVTNNSATLNGQITDTGGENPTVRVYWGASTGGTTPGNWDHVEDLGVIGVGFPTVDVSGLTPATTYFYRVYAENSGGGSWAAVTASFTTDNAPVTLPTITISPVQGIGRFSATVNGEIHDTGGDQPTIWIYYGTTDGGDVGDDWLKITAVGQRDVGLFEATLINLSEKTQYYYSVYAQNSAGGVWTPTYTFTTKTENPPATSREWWILY